MRLYKERNRGDTKFWDLGKAATGDSVGSYRRFHYFNQIKVQCVPEFSTIRISEHNFDILSNNQQELIIHYEWIVPQHSNDNSI